MQLRRLGKRGPEISVVGYGAWEAGGESYGPNPPEGEVIGAIHAALDAGMSWIDTAEIYGSGTSERLVGKAVRGRDALVATKVAPQPVGAGFEPDNVRRAARASLRRLGRGHIDLYQLHWFPERETVPIEETWAAMGELIDEGLVRCIGVSNFHRQQIERCLSVRHVDSLQPQFSMLHREGEELFSWCDEQGVAVIVYGPLAYGLLTGAIDESTRFDRRDWRSGSDPGHSYYRAYFAPPSLREALKVVAGLRPIARRLGLTPAQLALAWTLHQPGVWAAITGSRSPDHNRENAGAGDVSLSSEVRAEIEEIRRGFGQP